MRQNPLPFTRPLIEEDEIAEVVDTLKSNWLTTGPKTKAFEEKFKKYAGSAYAVALNSCTGGLHLGLVVAGISNGDEVITTPYTFTATAEVIIKQGAKPVFVDILEDTYNLDENQIVEKITKKTKAIIPMHFGGHPCEMKPILEIAEDYNLTVIEDAAHALGAEYEGKKIGTLSDITAFSFHPTKNITTGEGGMITTNNKEYAKRIKQLSLHGINKDGYHREGKRDSWYYEVIESGFKYNITDLQSAIGLVQIGKIERFWKIRNEYFEMYNSAFRNVPELKLPTKRRNVRHAFHLYPVLVNTELLEINRAEFIDLLIAKNIGVSVHYIPLHLHPYYKRTYNFKKGNYPITEYVGEHEISLPLYPKMDVEDVQSVITAVKDIIYEHRVG